MSPSAADAASDAVYIERQSLTRQAELLEEIREEHGEEYLKRVRAMLRRFGR